MNSYEEGVKFNFENACEIILQRKLNCYTHMLTHKVELQRR